MRRLLCLILLLAAGPGWAGDELITTAISKAGDVVPYVLNRTAAPPKYVLILFPGGTGIINPHLEDGKLVYEKQANFLLRARPFWVDDEFATVATDSSPLEDHIQALIDDLQRRFPGAQIYLMGTSRGTFDTMALAPYLSDKIAGEIHTTSLSNIGSFDARKYHNRHLVVHHRLDSCRFTSFSAAEYSHTHYGNELLVMDGGSSVGPACEVYAHHGYNGIERETTAAIKQWIKQGNTKPSEQTAPQPLPAP